ncbi:uncharacterized protein BDZ99DRAFT_463156 [Mytilinidion resinicola]|uniref:Uncharacterized protein n=1 Tax=Mytilinidion resinicola TaxID=574789 RepID=A0A6A6YL95_9PEZI|nr:uncharacterized protein BDZ99DRAFT_463156 [Mytilinidion resinicola]KAF2809308.1 hypothetical protein BDZ99DRAFT_463156 [Mytilinidion resinicola]
MVVYAPEGKRWSRDRGGREDRRRATKAQRASPANGPLARPRHAGRIAGRPGCWPLPLVLVLSTVTAFWSSLGSCYRLCVRSSAAGYWLQLGYSAARRSELRARIGQGRGILIPLCTDAWVTGESSPYSTWLSGKIVISVQLTATWLLSRDERGALKKEGLDLGKGSAQVLVSLGKLRDVCGPSMSSRTAEGFKTRAGVGLLTLAEERALGPW